jgi:genome maintenance exonuclease 1
MITYRPFVFEEIMTESRQGKRFYLTQDGAFPSVTTVLSHAGDNDSLEAWKKRVGEKEANRISSIAKRRGTAVHSLLEDYIHGKPVNPSAMPANIATFKQMKKKLDIHLTECNGIETPLYSKQIQVAGRCDAIGVWDGKLSIIDYKTSVKEKRKEYIESYFLQTSLYAFMLKEMKNLDTLPDIAILIGCDEAPEAQVFTDQASNYIERALDLVNEYYLKTRIQS